MAESKNRHFFLWQEFKKCHDAFLKFRVLMKSEAEIIGEATLRILRASPQRLLCRKSLIMELSREFSEIYELENHVENAISYEAILWLLIHSTDYPYIFANEKTHFE